jgi:predicted transcriptional regulator
MTPEAIFYKTCADALDAASAVFRQRAVAVSQGIGAAAPTTTPEEAVIRARALHPSLGPTQATLVEHMASYYPEWTNMGVLARNMNREQPNVHLTLKALIAQGVVDKDSNASPQLYRLSPALFRTEGDAAS